MSNININNVDLGSVGLGYNNFRDDNLALAAQGVAREGLILARPTAGGALVPFNPSGEDGSEVPRYVLTYNVDFAAAGTQPVRVLMDGMVDAQRLRVGVAGDPGVGITAAVVDALKDAKITALDSTQLSALDNQ